MVINCEGCEFAKNGMCPVLDAKVEGECPQEAAIWEQRRFELANSAMQAIISNPVTFEMMQKSRDTSKSIAKHAVEVANEIEKQMKGGR